MRNGWIIYIPMHWNIIRFLLRVCVLEHLGYIVFKKMKMQIVSNAY